jgi:hypothetical protein
MKVQQGSHRSEQPVRCTPSCYREQSKRIMRWWTWLGPTTNRTLLMIAGIVALPDWFCWFVIIPTNLYLAGMVVWQRKVSRRLHDAADVSAVGTTPITA